MQTFLAVILILISLGPPNRIEIQGENRQPEGLECDVENQRFLLSSMTAGTVYEIAHDGTATPFIEDAELVSSIGLEIEYERLFVVNADFDNPDMAMLGIYDFATRERLHMVDLGTLAPNYSHFPNDVALDSEGNAYVTDSLAPVIYQVDVDGNASIFLEDERLLIDGFGGNGIVYHPDNYLIVGISGVELYKIPLDNPQNFTVVETPEIISADGMLWDEELVVVSNGTVLKLTSDDEWTSATITARARSHPASTAAFCGEEVYVIHPQENEIVRVRFRS